MSLRDDLIRRKQRGFITVRVLEELITPSSVQELLSRNTTTSAHQVDPGLVTRTVPRARKLIAILVLTSLEANIPQIVFEQQVADHVFPISSWETIPCLDPEDAKSVWREQWTVPPVLERGRHLHIPDGAILPFLSEKAVNHGSFGIVYKVEIAEGHLGSDVLGRTKILVAALKKVEVREGKEDAVMQEVVAYRRRRHPNLVPLLASYTEHRTESGFETKRISMLFPYAEMDMETWLYLPRTPVNVACLSTSEQRLYLFTEAAKLVSALAALHKEVGGLVTSHHDLKPRNILVLGDDLMIADLGMSNLVHLDGGSGIDGADGIGTRSYRPPEYFKNGSWERDATRSFGRAFDMWAMGCIMIQLAVLAVWGWESKKVQDFRTERQRKRMAALCSGATSP